MGLTISEGATLDQWNDFLSQVKAIYEKQFGEVADVYVSEKRPIPDFKIKKVSYKTRFMSTGKVSPYPFDKPFERK